MNKLNYDLAAQGYNVVKSDYKINTYSVGCQYNPFCTCGADCKCGPSCTCGQDNNDNQTNLGDSLMANKNVNAPRPNVTGIKGTHRLTGASCTGRPEAEYMCNVICRTGPDGCPIPTMECNNSEFNPTSTLCGDHVRCGNGDTLKPYRYNISRQYGYLNPTEVPNYYPDLTQLPIGGRPVFVRGNRELIPEILLCDTKQNLDRCFSCRQPCWNEKCM